MLMVSHCIVAQTTDTSIHFSTPASRVTNLFQPIPNNLLPDLKAWVQNGRFVRLDAKVMENLQREQPNELIWTLPLPTGAIAKCILRKQQPLVASHKLRASSGDILSAYEQGLHYQGHIEGEDKASIAVSILSDRVMGMLWVEGKTYVLGHLYPNRHPASSTYILYQTSDLLVTPSFECADLSVPILPVHPEHIIASAKNTVAPRPSVKLYLEADYDLYTQTGGTVQHAVDYITGVFNIVQLLYKAEDVIIEISDLYLWTSPDPYTSDNALDAIEKFRARIGTDIDGDLAHLLSMDAGNHGGIAYVDVLCTDAYAVAYSNINLIYNDNPIPTYSWTTEVIAHEIGHNLGSPHTQSCNWEGGALDDCYPPEGSCERGPTPVNGGTIMSYCHLTQTGINYANGFGVQPGNKIRAAVASAACLTPSTTGEEEEERFANLTRHSATLKIMDSNISVNLVVVNNGDATARATQVRYFLTTDDQIDANDPVLGAKSLQALAAGSQSDTLSLSVEVNALQIPPGTYRVAYMIDPNNDIKELDELDNAFHWADTSVLVQRTDYCASQGTSTSYEYISRVQIGDWESETGDNDGYYLGRTDAVFAAGESLPFSLYPGYHLSAYREYWRIWIDLNQDGDFADIDELIFDSGVATIGEQSGTLTIPTSAKAGITRMRISMHGNTYYSAPPQCGALTFGEVEDYEIHMTNDNALPISLLELTAYPAPTHNSIKWITASEQSIVKYQLERATDPMTEGIFIAEKLVAHTSTTEHRYTVTDAIPPTRAYYRLHAWHEDGTVEFSHWIVVERPTNALHIAQVFPNPTQEQCTLTWHSPTIITAQWKLYDSMGRILQTGQTTPSDIGQQQLHVSLHNQQSG
ncbi:MAG: M12 family metallo-peptidase, partial [Bacteroidota bacterium]